MSAGGHRAKVSKNYSRSGNLASKHRVFNGGCCCSSREKFLPKPHRACNDWREGSICSLIVPMSYLITKPPTWRCCYRKEKDFPISYWKRWLVDCPPSVLPRRRSLHPAKAGPGGGS